MSIEGILNKIQADTDEKIAEIKAKTDREIEAIESEVAEFEKSEIEKAEERAETEAERAFEQEISRAETKFRMQTLAVKQELVQKAFDEGFKAILHLPADKLRGRYVEMLQSFAEKSGEIVFGKEDGEIFNDEFDKLVAEKIDGADFSKKRSEDFDHGFMLFAGKIQFDARAESIFGQIIEDFTDNVSMVLFGGE